MQTINSSNGTEPNVGGKNLSLSQAIAWRAWALAMVVLAITVAAGAWHLRVHLREHLAQRDGSYVVPIVHAHLPARAVEWGFWGALAGSAVLGAVDPPLAALVGLGVVVARHRRR